MNVAVAKACAATFASSTVGDSWRRARCCSGGMGWPVARWPTSSALGRRTAALVAGAAGVASPANVTQRLGFTHGREEDRSKVPWRTSPPCTRGSSPPPTRFEQDFSQVRASGGVGESHLTDLHPHRRAQCGAIRDGPALIDHCFTGDAGPDRDQPISTPGLRIPAGSRRSLAAVSATQDARGAAGRSRGGGRGRPRDGG